MYVLHYPYKSKMEKIIGVPSSEGASGPMDSTWAREAISCLPSRYTGNRNSESGAVAGIKFIKPALFIFFPIGARIEAPSSEGAAGTRPAFMQVYAASLKVISIVIIVSIVAIGKVAAHNS